MSSAPPSGADLILTADPILIDLDGTLTESEPGILASVRYALAAMGEPTPAPEVLRTFIGPPLAESLRDVCGMDPARVRMAISRYREYYGQRGQFENSVYDGIPQLLVALGAAGRTLAVATSKPQVFAESILAHFDLARHFSAVVGSELDGRRAHKAEILTEALVRLGRDSPQGAVMVGDRSHDVLGAESVGMPCIGVLWGYGSATELTGAGARALASTPAELGDLLGATGR